MTPAHDADGDVLMGVFTWLCAMYFPDKPLLHGFMVFYAVGKNTIPTGINELINNILLTGED